MKHYLLLTVILAGFSSCGARVVAMPPDAVEQALREGVNPPTDSAAAPDSPDPASTPAAPTASSDPAASAPALAPTDTPYSPSQVVADDLPSETQSGPASVLIDAPEGSTATYRLDNDAPVETGMSFSIDGIDPGEHKLEIEVTLPDGQRKTIDSNWTQVDREESSAVLNEVEGADTGPESVGIPTIPSKKKKDKPAPGSKSQGAEHADEHSAHFRDE
jgi:hypothetical protein